MSPVEIDMHYLGPICKVHENQKSNSKPADKTVVLT